MPATRVGGRGPHAHAWHLLGGWLLPPPLGVLGSGVHGLLGELAHALRPYAVVTAPYLALRQFFVEEYGVDGVCHDVQAFLARASIVLGRRRWWLDGRTPVVTGTTIDVLSSGGECPGGGPGRCCAGSAGGCPASCGWASWLRHDVALGELVEEVWLMLVT
jgi:hypothetical protein